MTPSTTYPALRIDPGISINPRSHRQMERFSKQFTRLRRPSTSPRNDFCCVSFLNRGPKEDGGRNARVFPLAGR